MTPIILMGANTFVGRRVQVALKGSSGERPSLSISRSVTNTLKSPRTINYNDLESIKYSEFSNCSLISVIPIWELLPYLSRMERLAPNLLVTLSTTSIFTKIDSRNQKEKELMQKIVESEQEIKKWCLNNNVKLTLLRPTLIYGLAQDQNVSRIAKFIKKYRFFPLVNHGKGLRQPIHVDDVAAYCCAPLTNITQGEFQVVGGSICSFKAIVDEVFHSLEIEPRYINVPFLLSEFLVTVNRCFLNSSINAFNMLSRMGEDMIFDDLETQKVFGLSPRPFAISVADLPV